MDSLSCTWIILAAVIFGGIGLIFALGRRPPKTEVNIVVLAVITMLIVMPLLAQSEEGLVAEWHFDGVELEEERDFTPALRSGKVTVWKIR